MLHMMKSQMEQRRRSERVFVPTSRCPWKLRYWPSQQCRARTSLPVGHLWIRSCQVWLPQALIDPLLATISGSASSLQLRCPELPLQKLFGHEEELNKYLKSTTGQVPHAEAALVRHRGWWVTEWTVTCSKTLSLNAHKHKPVFNSRTCLFLFDHEGFFKILKPFLCFCPNYPGKA